MFLLYSSVNILDKTIIEEKFQIRTNLPAKGKRLGDKIIKITLKSDKGTEDEGSVRSGKSSKVDHFQELVQTGYERAPAMEYKQLKTDKVPNEYFVYSACLLCLIILFLPQEDRANSSLYMLAVSFNVKLVVSSTTMRPSSMGPTAYQIECYAVGRRSKVI